jgi:hypothetical protein
MIRFGEDRIEQSREEDALALGKQSRVGMGDDL